MASNDVYEIRLVIAAALTTLPEIVKQFPGQQHQARSRAGQLPAGGPI